MELEEAAWGRIGGKKYPLIASLECRAVCLRSVGVCLLALGYVKMLTGDFLGEMSMPYVVGCRWFTMYLAVVCYTGVWVCKHAP